MEAEKNQPKRIDYFHYISNVRGGDDQQLNNRWA